MLDYPSGSYEAARAIEIQVNARAYGAVGDGVTDDSAAIKAMLTDAAAMAATYGGAVVYFPPGTYLCTIGSSVASYGWLRPSSNTVWRGAGRGISVIICDDSVSGADFIGNNTNNTTSYTALTNWTMRDLTVRGLAATTRTDGAQMVRVKGDNIKIEECRFEYSRGFGMVLTECTGVVVRNNEIFRILHDGIAVWNSSSVVIQGNDILQTSDDAISCHSDDSLAAPVRSGIIITDNTITESQGIAVLGAKSVVIANNILRRIMAIGIRVRAPSSDTQGQTPLFACQIKNNIVADVFQRQEASAPTLLCLGIWVTGGTRRLGAGAAYPGEPASGTGTVVDLHGTNGPGTLYANETGAGGAASPAGRWVEVVGNQVIRTLPSVTTASQWGYSSSASGLWIGKWGDGTGYYNGSIPAAALRPTGIRIDQALHDSRIADNIIETGGANSIEIFNSPTVVSGDFRMLTIERNKISDFTGRGIYLGADVTIQRILVRDNEINGDPYFRSANRGSGGTWLASTTPIGIDANNIGGAFITGNHFFNVAISVQGPADGSKYNMVRQNFQYGEAVGLNFSTSNKGCGTMMSNAPGGWTTIPVNSDPTSAGFMQQTADMIVAQSSIPAWGTYTRGYFVWNTNPADSGGKVLLGWARESSGSGHVSGTDWNPVYGTIT